MKFFYKKDPHLIIRQIEECGVVLEEMFADNTLILKGIVLSSFTHTHDIPNPYDFLLFMHLADAFYPKQLCIQGTNLHFHLFLLTLGIEPMTLALLEPGLALLFYCLSYR